MKVCEYKISVSCFLPYGVCMCVSEPPREPPSSFFQQMPCVGSPEDLVPSDSLPNSCRNITSADFSKDK